MTDQLPEYAISIRQPWAHSIINLGKDIENRSWRTKFRGAFCIHAAKGMTNDELDEFNKCAAFAGNFRPLERKDFEFGGIIGVAEIEDCVIHSDSSWFVGPYGFLLTKIRSVEFIPVRGQLGFFKWRKNTITVKPAIPDRQRDFSEIWA